MAADIATLGVDFDTTDLTKGEKALNQTEAAANKAAGAADRVGEQARKMGAAWLAASQTAQKQISGFTDVLKQGQAAQAAYTQQVLDNARKQQQAYVQTAKVATQSAKQQAQAMRMLPAQMTDIFVGLSTGQSPMMVMLQQGGQLKDMFGGIGAAAKATSGFILNLMTPLNIAIAAFGALGAAAFLGSKEMTGYNEAIVMSGNSSGTTSGQMQVMASNIDKVVGTAGNAAGVLQMMVASGRVSNDDLERFALMAVRLDRLGVEAKDVVENLSRLGKDPVQASAKLNEALNYLDAATYRSIKGLADLGKEDEAGELAQRAYAAAMEVRATKLESSLGSIERLWRGIKDAAGEAWDSMKGVGRAPDTDQMLTNVQNALAKARGTFDPSAFTGNASQRAQVPDLEEQERRLLRIREIQTGNAAAEKQKTDQSRATVEFEKLAESSLSKQDKLANEIAKAKKLGVESGAEQAAIDKVIVNLMYDQTKLGIETQIERLNSVQQVMEIKTKGILSDLDAQRRTGAINEISYIQQAAQADITSMQSRISILQQQKALKATERDSEKEVASIQRQIEVESAQIALRKKERENDLTVALYQRQQAIYAVIRAQQEEFQQDVAMERVAADRRYAAADAQVRAYIQSVQDGNDDLKFQLSLVGKTADEQARLNEQRRVEIGLRNEKRRIEESARGGNLTKDQVADLTTRAEQAAAKALEGVDTKLYIDKWNEANREVSSTLFNLLTNRGQNAADQLKKLFEDLVLRPQIQPMANALTTWIQQAGSQVFSGGSQGGSPPNPYASGSSNGFDWTSLFSSSGGAVNGNDGSGIGQFGGSPYTGSGGGGFNMGSLSSMFGGTLGSGGNGTAFSGGGSMGGAMGYIGAAMTAYQSLKNHQWGAAAGGVIGGYFGGPMGAQIGAQIGAAIDKATAGEKRVGAHYIDGKFSEGPSGGQVSGADEATLKAMDGINDLFKKLNSDVRLSYFNSALEESTHGKGFVYADGRLSTGAVFGDKNDHNNRRGNKTAQEALEQYGEELKQATLQALQAADLPGELGKYLSKLGDINELTGGSLDRTLARTEQIIAEKEKLDDQIFSLTHSEADQLIEFRRKEKESLDEVNRSLADRLYALQDEKSAADKLANAISTASLATVDFTNFIGGVNTGIRQYIDKLNATPAGLGTTVSQVSNSKSQFDQQIALARAGDRNALSNITQYGDQLIQAQTRYTASGQPSQDIVSYVKAALQGLPTMETSEEYLARVLRETSEKQVDATKAAAIAVSNKLWDGLWGSAGLLATKFDMVDTNMDKLLSFDELKTAIGPLASDETLRSLIAIADVNGDGQLTYLEIINASVWNTALAQIQAQQQAAAQTQQVISTASQTSAAAVGQATTNAISAWWNEASMNGINGSGGGYFNASGGYALGGAFLGGREVTAFANGGVVSQPTYFNMGLMGEAGPEAIMPLARGRNGRLGVTGPQMDFSRLEAAVNRLYDQFSALLTVSAAGFKRVAIATEETASNTAGNSDNQLLLKVTKGR